MGLSRNKVAVPEGAAGTPPFWIGLLFLYYLNVYHHIKIDVRKFSLLVLASLFYNIEMKEAR